jgi:hypothetical protein
MGGTTLLEAPADRPAGHRGWRAWLACGVAAAAVPLLAVSSQVGLWERAAYFGAAAALVTAAVIIWTARRTPALVLAGGAVAASVAVVSLIGDPYHPHVSGGTGGAEMEYTYDPDGRAITRSQAKAVPKGSTEDEVEEILGSAAGDGTLRRRDGTDSSCLVYREEAVRASYDPVFAFCFAGDRYASLHRW